MFNSIEARKKAKCPYLRKARILENGETVFSPRNCLGSKCAKWQPCFDNDGAVLCRHRGTCEDNRQCRQAHHVSYCYDCPQAVGRCGG